jgi:hypothetical protein
MINASGSFHQFELLLYFELVIFLGASANLNWSFVDPNAVNQSPGCWYLTHDGSMTCESGTCTSQTAPGRGQCEDLMLTVSGFPVRVVCLKIKGTMRARKTPLITISRCLVASILITPIWTVHSILEAILEVPGLQMKLKLGGTVGFCPEKSDFPSSSPGPVNRDWGAPWCSCLVELKCTDEVYGKRRWENHYCFSPPHSQAHSRKAAQPDASRLGMVSPYLLWPRSTHDSPQPIPLPGVMKLLALLRSSGHPGQDLVQP